MNEQKGLGKTKFEGIFKRGRNLLTRNLTPGKKFFLERLFKKERVEYREWDARKSKLAAGILKGISTTGLKKDSVVLYLGASHGYTCSYVSDIVTDGLIFAVDPAPRVMRDLVFLCEVRKNIAPVYGDGNKPAEYLDRVSAVDMVFQDVAQKNQAEIFLKNVEMYLQPGGIAILSVKARSVDVTRQPKKIFNEIKSKLEKNLKILDFKTLEPFELDHCIFVCRK